VLCQEPLLWPLLLLLLLLVAASQGNHKLQQHLVLIHVLHMDMNMNLKACG
jgi:hypothetical protein